MAATGMNENEVAGKKGGIARKARVDLEEKTGRSVVMASIDLRDKFSPVRNQGRYLPACTSFALASCVEYLAFDGFAKKVLSPLYLYYYQREGVDGIVDTNITQLSQLIK